MGRFSVAEVALTGFRIVRERRRIVLLWIVLQLVVSAGFGVIMVGMAGPALTRLYAGGGMLASQDPARNLALIRQLGPMYLVLLAFCLIFYPVLYAAMNRAVLRPADARF